MKKQDFEFLIEPLRITILLLVLPNILFLVAAYLLSVARPLIDLDYFIAIILIYTPLRLLKYLGCFAYIMFFLIDSVMLITQKFPFIDIGGLLYLLPFTFKLPPSYLVIVLILTSFFILYTVTVITCIYKSSQSKKMYHSTSMSVIILFLLSILAIYQLDEVKYTKYYDLDGYKGRFGTTNHYVIHSQLELYYGMLNDRFLSEWKLTPELIPYSLERDRAVTKINTATSSKILFIMAESFGGYSKEDEREAIVSSLLAKSDKLEFIDYGVLEVAGSNTIQGEMRELCNYHIIGGYAFRDVPNTAFKDCLPSILKRQGYETISFLGLSGTIYDNVYWYEKAGFNRSFFLENLSMDLDRCKMFNAICDIEFPALIATEFSRDPNRKKFVYWLTMSAHAPFVKEDIRETTHFDCEKYGIKKGGEVCRNTRLNVQLFDSIATLVDMPEMVGTEVIVVGDHMPPFFADGDYQEHFIDQGVGWVHFKIKN